MSISRDSVAIARTLGGSDGPTLFVLNAEVMSIAAAEPGSARIETVRVSAGRAGFG